MAKYTKRIRLPGIHPPPEIREKTKERRAWLNEKLAEILAQPNRDAKIVGTGSYQTISVWETQETEGRVQYRGVCQGCGGSVAIEEKTTSHHGYQRPGYGYTVGRCVGAQELPANKDLTITHKLIESLQGHAKLHNSKMEEIQKKLDEFQYPTEDEWNTDRDGALKRMNHNRELERDLWKYRTMKRQAEDYIAHLQTTAIPALGTPFKEVILP